MGRVIGGQVGASSGGTNNYARSDMPGTWTSTGAANRDGASVSTTTPNGGYNSRTFWEGTLTWDFVNVWEMSGGVNSLPILQN